MHRLWNSAIVRTAHLVGRARADIRRQQHTQDSIIAQWTRSKHLFQVEGSEIQHVISQQRHFSTDIPTQASTSEVSRSRGESHRHPPARQGANTSIPTTVAASTAPNTRQGRVSLHPGDLIDVAIESPSEDGCVGRYGGFVVFVRNACPGETVRARVTLVKGNFARAEVESVVAPSVHEPIRQPNGPPCPVYSECGGCDMMHLTYNSQLILKHQRVVDALQRIGRLARQQRTDSDSAELDPQVARNATSQIIKRLVEPVIMSPRQFGYRNRVKLHLRPGNPPALPTTNASSTYTGPDQYTGLTQQLLFPTLQQLGARKPAFKMGYLAHAQPMRLVDIAACPIAAPEVNAKIRIARRQAGEYSSDTFKLYQELGQSVEVIEEDTRSSQPAEGTNDASQTSTTNTKKARRGHNIHTRLAQDEEPEQIHGKLWKMQDFARPQRPAQLHFRMTDFGAWKVPLNAFFQTNLSILPQFVSSVRRCIFDAQRSYEAACSSAAVSPHPRTLLDLHCGVGFFAISLALPQSLFEKSLKPSASYTDSLADQDPPSSSFPGLEAVVNSGEGQPWYQFAISNYIGAEINDVAISAAQANAARLGVDKRGYFFRGDVSGFLKILAKEYERLSMQTNAEIQDDIPDESLSFSARFQSIQRDLRSEASSGWRFGTVPSLEATTIIVDPPRAGLPSHTTDELLRIGAAQIVYVSCNPATLARDIARLCGTAQDGNQYPESGGVLALQSQPASLNTHLGLPGPGKQARYAVARVIPIDMFPQTHHVEVIVDLRRID